MILSIIAGKPLASVSWWSEEVLLDDTFSTGPHGFVRNELFIGNLNRTDFMLSLTCKAENSNLTVPTQSSITLDMNRKQAVCHKNACVSQRREKKALLQVS